DGVSDEVEAVVGDTRFLSGQTKRRTWRGGPTGYAINPARDLGPRIVHALLPLPNKGGSDWGYAWIPVAGPLIGGALAAGIYTIAFA
ncbi:aquaporin, partial [Streptomyces sp. NPDC000963]